MKYYLIGYSGHAYVTIESAFACKYEVLGYFETEEKKQNPYNLSFMGTDENLMNNNRFNEIPVFVGLGDNSLRSRIFEKLKHQKFINIIDPSANVSNTVLLNEGIYIGKNACVNALSKIGKGAIINTAAIVEHDCDINDFVHIAPGAVLCGNVKVEKNSFIGANSVIKQGITIGSNVVIGAGSVVVKNVPDAGMYVGIPLRKIR